MDSYYRKVMIVVVTAVVLSAFVKTTETAPTPVGEYNPLAVLPLLKLENSLPQTGASQGAPLSRSKRAIIFRPLFVYRQQQIKHNLVNAKYEMNPDKIKENYYAGQFL